MAFEIKLHQKCMYKLIVLNTILQILRVSMSHCNICKPVSIPFLRVLAKKRNELHKVVDIIIFEEFLVKCWLSIVYNFSWTFCIWLGGWGYRMEVCSCFH